MVQMKTIWTLLSWAACGALAVDLPTCKTTILQRLSNGTLEQGDPIFYHKTNASIVEGDNLFLTVEGCRATCPQPDFDLYDDMWPRLLTWLIPALLLIGNLHIARVGSFNRFLAILHFLGDPIDSAWSLLTKAEIWSRFYVIAKRHTPKGPDAEPRARALAAMLAAFEELTGDMASVHLELQALITENGAQLSRLDLDHIMLETAEELVDSRSNEVLRASLVILNYIWTVLSSLVEQIGGPQSSQPGGRIGTAMFLSWLVTIVMLSNTLSGFVSRRTCLRIMERYCRTLKGRRRDQHVFPNSPFLASKSGWTFGKALDNPIDYIDAQPWNGGLYSFRPRKQLVVGNSADRGAVHLLLLSIAPILVAATSAFILLWYTPTMGLGCRGLWIVSAALSLLISPVLTWLVQKLSTGRLAWYLTAAKDAAIGVSVLTIIVCSSIGVFNTCTCWSSVYSRGANAYVDLDPVKERIYHATHLYPATVAVCLGLQLVIYILMFRIMRPGAKVFRPDEDEKMSAYRRIHGLDDNGEEMRNSLESNAGRHRLSTAGSDSGELLLPPPAISPHTSPQLLARGQRTQPWSPGDYFAVGRTASTSSASEASLGASPEWRSLSSEQPLLGSPVLRRPSERY